MKKGTFTAADGSTAGYLFYKTHADADAAAPMIVYLHGTDGCGSDPMHLLEIESCRNIWKPGASRCRRTRLCSRRNARWGATGPSRRTQ